MADLVGHMCDVTDQLGGLAPTDLLSGGRYLCIHKLQFLLLKPLNVVNECENFAICLLFGSGAFLEPLFNDFGVPLHALDLFAKVFCFPGGVFFLGFALLGAFTELLTTFDKAADHLHLLFDNGLQLCLLFECGFVLSG